MYHAIRKFKLPEYDYSCSEATLHAANEAFQMGLEEKSLKMMAGFSGGLMSEDLCGVVSASIAVLSVMFTNEVAHQSPLLKKLVIEYLEKVDSTFGSKICVDIKRDHRDHVLNSCNEVVYKNADILAEVINSGNRQLAVG